MTEPPAEFMDMEGDLLGAVDLGDAVYSLVEAGCKDGLSARQATAVLRCVAHLQDHAEAALRIWNSAIRLG